MCDATVVACVGAWANVGVAVATFALVVLVVFQQQLWHYLHRPELGLQSDVIRTPFENPPTASKGVVLFLRLRLTNEGNDAARDVEVCVNKVGVLQGGLYRLMREAEYPKALVWSNERGKTAMPFLHPGTTKLVDLAHIHDLVMREEFRLVTSSEELDPPVPDKTAMALEVNPAPLSRGHIFPPGKYRLHVVVSASNMDPVDVTVDVELTGAWSESNETVVSAYSVVAHGPRPTFVQ